MDAIDLFDLSEAGRLLLRDPVRLAREARLRRVPSTRVEGTLAFPRPWVEAEAGIAPVDAESLRDYWLTRLAPPSPGGHRARRERDRLPAEDLLVPAEAARRVLCDDVALERLAVDQTLPPLRIDGEVRYDAALVDLVARDAAGEDVEDALRERWAAVVGWARFDYATEVELPQNRVASVLPKDAPEAKTEATPTTADASVPKAFEIPSDLADLPPPSTLADADGFDTVDED